ncbi:MAG: hypothetical protein V9G14_12970 [Cypionkella sp.]
MQFLVPLVITMGVFGAMGGDPQPLSDGGKLWMQNAGFVWVPFILLSTIAAWARDERYCRCKSLASANRR